MAKKQGMKLKRITSLFMSAMVLTTSVQFQMTLGAAAENDAAGGIGSSSVSAENVGMTSNANAYKSYIEKHADAAKPMEEIVVDVTNFTADGVDAQLKDFQGQEDCVEWIDSKGNPFSLAGKRGSSCSQKELFREICVDLSNELVCVRAVNSASHFDAFAACRRAAEAVHTDLKEEGCNFGSHIENVADDCFFRNLHCKNLSVPRRGFFYSHLLLY